MRDRSTQQDNLSSCYHWNAQNQSNTSRIGRCVHDQGPLLLNRNMQNW